MKQNELIPQESRSLRNLIDERIEWLDAHPDLDITHDNYRGLKKFWRVIRAKLK